MMTSRNGFRIQVSDPVMARWVTPALGILLLWILLLVIYWPSGSGQWYLDDFGNIHQNPNVHARSLTWDALYPAVYGRSPVHRHLDRPVAYLTLAANYAVGGTDPFGYHVVNVLIHLLTTAVIYLLVRTTLAMPAMRPRYGASAHAVALLGALLWAIHPIQVTAVTYVIQRMASLAAMFSLASLLCFARGLQAPAFARKAAWVAAAVALGLLAFGSKQNAVMLPVSMALYVWVFRPGDPARPTNRRRWLFAAGAVILVGMVALYHVGPDALLRGYRDRPFTLFQRLITEPRVLWFYLWMLVYPINARFTLLHDFEVSTGVLNPWTTLPAMVLLLAAAGVAAGQRGRRPLLAFGVLFFLFNHAVEGSVLPLELVFEHRNYLPTVFLCVAAAAGILSVMDHFKNSRLVQTMTVSSTVLVIIAAGHTTYLRNDVFTDRVALWQQNVAAYPDLHRPRHNLARALFDTGAIRDGLVEMTAALHHRGGARRSQKLVTYYNLGLAYMALGDLDAAEKAFGQVVSLARGHKGSWIQLAHIALERHQPQAAASLAAQVGAIDGSGFHYHTLMGLAALSRNDVTAARHHARLAVARPWEDPSVFCLLRGIAAASGMSYQETYFGRLCPLTR
jgi:hypothetical protein